MSSASNRLAESLRLAFTGVISLTALTHPVEASAYLPQSIQTYYKSNKEHIVSATQYPEYQAVLVTSGVGDKTIPNRYDWWDIRTNTLYYLPNAQYFIRKVDVVSTQEVRLWATGANGLDGYRSFPFLIDCWRPDTKSPFQPTEKPYYMRFSETAHFGGSKPETLSDMRVTLDGIEFAFSP